MSGEGPHPELGRLVDVELWQVPLGLYVRARQHSDDLQREFALIRLGQDLGENSVPHRLLELVNHLGGRFRGFSEPSYAALDEALTRGDAETDVVFTIPEAAAPAAERLGRMFDEADDFCRSGELLTLEASADIVAFRNWFLGEFVRQIAGEPPRPWPEYGPA